MSIGVIAAILSTAAFLPQSIKTIKTRDTSGISLPMYIIFSLGISFWIVYGVQKMDWSIILGNSFIIVFVIPILFIKIKSILDQK